LLLNLGKKIFKADVAGIDFLAKSLILLKMKNLHI